MKLYSSCTLLATLGTTSQAPIFGGPNPAAQQQTLPQNLFTGLQQPQTAIANQQPSGPASFNFHSTQATAVVTKGSSSAPSLSFGSQLGFGQPGSARNSGGSLTGLAAPGGLGGTDAGATKLQFGGNNAMGGMFSAGGSTSQTLSSKDSSVQSTGFNFNAGGGINLNFAGGTSTDSPTFSADSSGGGTVPNRLYRKARRRKA